MTRLIIIAAVFCLAAPAARAVPPAGKGKPETKPGSSDVTSQTVEKNAAKSCKAERGTTAESMAAFKAKYGKNANMKNAFGKCVSMKAQQLTAAAQELAEKNAAKKCKKERDTDPVAFKTNYGTNKNKSNAFGKCVSKLAKEQGSSS